MISFYLQTDYKDYGIFNDFSLPSIGDIIHINNVNDDIALKVKTIQRIYKGTDCIQSYIVTADIA